MCAIEFVRFRVSVPWKNSLLNENFLSALISILILAECDTIASKCRMCRNRRRKQEAKLKHNKIANRLKAKSRHKKAKWNQTSWQMAFTPHDKTKSAFRFAAKIGFRSDGKSRWSNLFLVKLSLLIHPLAHRKLSPTFRHNKEAKKFAFCFLLRFGLFAFCKACWLLKFTTDVPLVSVSSH